MAYVMAKLAAFPLAAWLALRFGPARVLVTSTILLLTSSLACAVTMDLSHHVAWRTVQGAGGGALLAAGQARLFEVFPRKRQGLVQAAFALSTIMGPTTVAPALQGWMTDTLSWSCAFLLNLPAGTLGLLAMLYGFGQEPPNRPVARLDWPGLGLIAVAVVCLVFVLQEGSRYDWFEEPKIAHLTMAGLLALALFVIWEVRARAMGALVDFGVFRDPHFTFGFIVSFVAGFALFGSAFIIPAFAIGALDLPPTDAGLLLLPSGILVGLGHLAAGGLIQFKGLPPFKLIPLGILCFMAGMWLLSGSTGESGAPNMMTALLVRGFGLGLLFVSLTMATLGDLRGPLVSHGVALAVVQ